MAKEKKAGNAKGAGSRGGRAKRHVIAAALTLAAFAVYDYVMLPAYNIQSTETWFTVCAALFVFGLLELILNAGLKLQPVETRGSEMRGTPSSFTIVTDISKPTGKLGKYFVYAAIAVAAAGLICSLISSEMFNAKRYASIAGPIETRDFIADTPASETISDIALMDTGSAQIIGARALGSLNELVSQFEINPQYTQINLKGKPMKVTPLEYADFFRWWSNQSTGIPGYIAVDPVANTSQYVKLEKPMQYAESAYFSKDLRRHLRFNYRTAIFGDSYFEIGEDGTPYYITAVLKKDVFLFGGTDVKGAVILNASTGETQYYDVADVPNWVDIVYDGAMLTQRYDWYGELSGGFFNSIFAKKDCKHVTADFGYKMFDNDVWVFTGVTSVASDQSNIGFVLMNSRTAEIRYYAIPGAEEYSVMRSAEGEVQNLGYDASFPSVINVEGQPTYIMVLKDKGSLVKQYALIHVERYNIVVTATTQREVMVKYKNALIENGMLDGTSAPVEDSESETVTVKDVKYLVQDGNSYAYLISDKKKIYKVDCSEFETIVLVQPGDRVKLSSAEEESGVSTVLGFEIL